MKITISEKEVQKKVVPAFPAIYQYIPHPDLLVLFVDNNSGICLQDGGYRPGVQPNVVGEFSDVWIGLDVSDTWWRRDDISVTFSGES